MVSSGGGNTFCSSGLSVLSGGIPPRVSRSFPSFTPWVSPLVMSSSPWSCSPSLVSSVASVSSTSVAWAGGFNLAQPSSCVMASGVSSSPAVAGSSFVMSSILAPVSTVVSSCVISSGVSASWSSPSFVTSVPPVVWSSVAGSVPSVPGVGVVSGSLRRWGCADALAAHKNLSAIPAPEGLVVVFADPLAFAEGDDTTSGFHNEPHSAFKQVVALITGLFLDARPSVVKPSDPASWFRSFGDEKQRDPKVFLSCFDRIRSIMADVEERSTVAAQGRKKAFSVLPSWARFMG